MSLLREISGARSWRFTRIYDTGTDGKGRLRESYAGGNETTGANVQHMKVQAFDVMGRPTEQRQRFKTNSVWSAEYQTQRSYNLAGNVILQTYPSTNTVTYNYDAAGRLSDKDAQNEAFKGNLGGVPRTYSSGILYSPLGGMAKEQFGTDTALYNKSFYNSRGQLSEIRVGTTYTGPTDLSWNRGAIINSYSNQCSGTCNGTDNNGNLKKQEVFIPLNDQLPTASWTSWSQGYEYDNLNRLQRVKEFNSSSIQLWQQEYVYDRWGNRTVHQSNTWGPGGVQPPIPKPNFGVNQSTNRLTSPLGSTMTYDNAGNLTADTYTGAGLREYDAENRMTKAWGGNSQWQEYTYNADGQRVRRKVDGVETWQIYGIDGELLAEYPANGGVTSPQKEYGYRNGQLLITADVTTTPLVPTFSDDFNDNSLDTGKWSVVAPGAPAGASTQIFINTQSSNYQLSIGKLIGFDNSRGNAVPVSDWNMYMGSASVHERSHRDSPTLQTQNSEGRAYTEQLRVLQKFGPKAFKNKEFFFEATGHVMNGSERP